MTSKTKNQTRVALPTHSKNGKHAKRAQVDEATRNCRSPVEKIMKTFAQLPIESARGEIIQALKNNQVVIVVGETGSGKTTRLPVYLYQEGMNKTGRIGISEPRKVATTSVAHFVAKQLGSQMGGVVGYQIRFDTQADQKTDMLFMTDGILLRRFQKDPLVREFSVLMIDEAHERSGNIDFVLGLAKQALLARSDFHVVIASATIDAEKFSRYFNNAPIVKASGRLYPVSVTYLEREVHMSDERGRFSVRPMVEAAAKLVLDIHKSGKEGDVLVFMPGKDEIRMASEILAGARYNDVMILPVHAGMDPEDQNKIFADYPGKRKIVIATNIAETSITIDGVVFVVDTGLIKQKNFHPQYGIESLDLVSHSRSGCDQRAGRAGRTQSGFCYRLYTEASYKARPEYSVPEILRVSLAGVVLTMEDIGIDPMKFEFIDQPDRMVLAEAYETLIALGAIEKGKKGLTEVGRRMAKLPLDPTIARMVLEAQKHGCVQQIVAIASMLSAQNILARPRDKELEADRAHKEFVDAYSDAITLLKVWQAYRAHKGDLRIWCREKFVNSRAMVEAVSVCDQLCEILEQSGVEITSNDDENVVRKSVVAGFIFNLMFSRGMHDYHRILREGGDMLSVNIHPGSALFSLGPSLLVAASVVKTSRTFARVCTKVDLPWLKEFLPGMVREEMEVVEADQGTRQAMVHVNCLFGKNGSSISIAQETRAMPFAVARPIQEERILDAKARGWKQVVFTRQDSIFEIADDRGHCASSHDANYARVVIGEPYYCEIISASQDVFLRGRTVAAKFRVLNLGNGSAPVAVEAPLEVSQDLAASLQAVLGGGNMGKGSRRLGLF